MLIHCGRKSVPQRNLQVEKGTNFDFVKNHRSWVFSKISYGPNLFCDFLEPWFRVQNQFYDFLEPRSRVKICSVVSRTSGQGSKPVLWFLRTISEVYKYMCFALLVGSRLQKVRTVQHWTKWTRGVSHTVALPFTLKSIFRQKEELWKFKYFTMQKYNLQKTSSQRNQNPSTYHNSIITNLKFQHKPKYHLSKILICIKIDLLPRGQNPLSYNTL